MNREAVESLDKETLIRLVLSQAETIAALTRQVEMLMARVVELEAKLGLPSKTPDNSSTPPSQGQKQSEEPAARRGRCGFSRPMVPTPSTLAVDASANIRSNLMGNGALRENSR